MDMGKFVKFLTGIIRLAAICSGGILGAEETMREKSSLEEESMTVMFWNVENFFDFKDEGGGDSDREFSPGGTRRWSKSRFYTKCDGVAKTIFAAADVCGGLPDVIGLAEVENAFVLRSLVNSTLLRKAGYRIVHFDSPDRRGIDVALLYREEVFELIRAFPQHLYDDDGTVLRTRDILVVQIRRHSDSAFFTFLVNHHPSKFGGEEASRGRRERAMRTLKHLCDSLSAVEMPAAGGGNSGGTTGGISGIVAMGDFNDTPDAEIFGIMAPEMTILVPEAARRGEGSIKFNGKWELIDLFFVSENCIPKNTHPKARLQMSILQLPFLLTPDRKHCGQKPLRTYSGPRYNAGLSDHLPIIVRFPSWSSCCGAGRRPEEE